MEHQDGTFRSYLEEKGGVEKPPVVDPNAVARFKSRKRKQKVLTAKDYVQGIRSGNRTLLSQAITIVESNLQEHYELAQEIITECLPFSGNSIRIGITGVPGAGKSTFIESFGKYITQKKHSLAVLAIDPSSERTKGSILGDKTRMVELSVDENAYIRPSPSAGSLGGVARKTRESIILCEAAGFNHIFIETVGVGQSETAVHSMTDFFLLLMLAGAGDELQGIKRGIMEMADLIAINKADGNNQDKALMARRQYQNALHLFPRKESDWMPEVHTCSSLTKMGIEDIWKRVEDYRQKTMKNGYFINKRKEQASYWMHETIQDYIKRSFYYHPLMKEKLKVYEQRVLDGELSSFAAAGELFDIFSNIDKK